MPQPCSSLGAFTQSHYFSSVISMAHMFNKLLSTRNDSRGGGGLLVRSGWVRGVSSPVNGGRLLWNDVHGVHKSSSRGSHIWSQAALSILCISYVLIVSLSVCLSYFLTCFLSCLHSFLFSFLLAFLLPFFVCLFVCLCFLSSSTVLSELFVLLYTFALPLTLALSFFLSFFQ